MAAAPNDSALWIRRFHPAPDSAIRLVCLPHAGGSAAVYFPMSRALKDDADVLSVQYPGRQDRRGEPGVRDMAEYADRVYDALLPWNDRPLALFGHSMGAVIAFEVARRLEGAGTVPARLFVSGRRAPSRTREGEDLHRRDDAGLIEEMRRLDGTDSSLLDDPELLPLILPALRSDYTAIETYAYRPGPPLATPVTALVGDADPRATLKEVRAWSDHTGGAFDMEVFTGGHFYLTEHQDRVAALVSRHLRALRTTGPRH
ncbi:thioesterase II family protein [Nocardiopsis sediminis]|uniref:Thioesterase II family protein n=1 Tax=Nocardiopsis sediminis TaxID=1778267 RepID=A0ABV8FL82_9ACTN